MTNATEKSIVYLTIIDPNRREKTHPLAEENSLLIGSGKNAAIQLRDPQIASVHCLVRYSQGTLTVDDWCSASGTFVNSTIIDAETELRDGDTISIGGCSITIGSTPPAQPIEHCQPEIETSPRTPAQSNAPSHSTATDTDGSISREETAPPTQPSPEPELAPASVESPEDSWASWFSESTNDSDMGESVSFEDETIHMLNLEVSSLQAELETRTAYITELEDQLNGPISSPTSDGQADHLDNRLSELLSELERSDQRTKTLEDLLHCSDHAIQAEKEEREQIESWIGDIEARVAGRESEWQAEREMLVQQIDQLRNDRDRISTSLKSDDDSNNLKAQEQMIQELRDELNALEQSLKDSESQREHLQHQLDSTDVQTMLERQQQVVEEAVREEQLAIARERAEFSRTKAELLRRVSELEAEPVSEKREVSDADARFHAFREHLREMNESPKAAQASVPLTKRLVNLWNRLEYGPTDTE